MSPGAINATPEMRPPKLTTDKPYECLLKIPFPGLNPAKSELATIPTSSIPAEVGVDKFLGTYLGFHSWAFYLCQNFGQAPPYIIFNHPYIGAV
jgi:hypothetical protein